MKTFALDGYYKYGGAPNGKGRLTGELEVADDGSFESLIRDHASMNPEQIIRGHLVTQNELDKLIFLKFPPNSSLANLSYDLEKNSNGKLEGIYTGTWGALPHKVTYFADYNLFLAQIDMSMCNIGDDARIRLSRK